nr:MAG TPA: hypothetical protein [Caudoviricetes sp.]
MEGYINIYGLLFAKTADGKLALTSQLWDETKQKFQSEINAETPSLEDGKIPISQLPDVVANAARYEIVAELPGTGEANVIYLIKREGEESPAVYDAHIWVDEAWADFAGGSGGATQAAVLYDQAQSLEEGQKQQARENIGAASQADVDDINKVLFTQYTALSFSRTPASFEDGQSTQVTLNWSTKFNNEEVTPDSIEVKKGDTVLASDVQTKSVTDTITTTQSYSMTAVIKGITKTASVTVNAYKPMYFGASAKETLESADVLGLTKQAIKSSPAGNVTVKVGANEYLWLCVPSTMNINSVKSGGFDVPMNQPTTVSVDGLGDYKCYRSASPFAEGTFTGVIA